MVIRTTLVCCYLIFSLGFLFPLVYLLDVLGKFLVHLVCFCNVFRLQLLLPTLLLRFLCLYRLFFGWHIFLYLQRVPAVFLYHINVVFRSVSSGTTFALFLFEIFSHLIDTPRDLLVFLNCRCGDFHYLTRLHLLVLLLLLFLSSGYGGLPAGGDDL